MRHARHDKTITAGLATLAKNAAPSGQKYLVVVIDGPEVPIREASYSSNLTDADCAIICEQLAQQIRAKAN